MELARRESSSPIVKINWTESRHKRRTTAIESKEDDEIRRGRERSREHYVSSDGRVASRNARRDFRRNLPKVVPRFIDVAQVSRTDFQGEGRGGRLHTGTRKIDMLVKGERRRGFTEILRRNRFYARIRVCGEKRVRQVLASKLPSPPGPPANMDPSERIGSPQPARDIVVTRAAETARGRAA